MVCPPVPSTIATSPAVVTVVGFPAVASQPGVTGTVGVPLAASAQLVGPPLGNAGLLPAAEYTSPAVLDPVRVTVADVDPLLAKNAALVETTRMAPAASVPKSTYRREKRER
jgi:hypothetical protein